MCNAFLALGGQNVFAHIGVYHLFGYRRAVRRPQNQIMLPVITGYIAVVARVSRCVNGRCVLHRKCTADQRIWVFVAGKASGKYKPALVIERKRQIMCGVKKLQNAR